MDSNEGEWLEGPSFKLRQSWLKLPWIFNTEIAADWTIYTQNVEKFSWETLGCLKSVILVHSPVGN